MFDPRGVLRGTNISHTQGGGTNIFDTLGGTNIFTHEGGTNIFTHMGGTNNFTHRGGGAHWTSMVQVLGKRTAALNRQSVMPAL